MVWGQTNGIIGLKVEGSTKWRDRLREVIALFQRRDNKGLQQGVSEAA